MTTPFHRPVELVLRGEDFCALLTAAICDGFGVFKALQVASVREVEGGGYRLLLESKPKPLAMVKPKEGAG